MTQTRGHTRIGCFFYFLFDGLGVVLRVNLGQFLVSVQACSLLNDLDDDDVFACI